MQHTDMFFNLFLDDPDAPKLDSVALKELFREEYQALSAEEKEEFREEHANNKKDASTFCRPSAKGRVMDVHNTVDIIKHLVQLSSTACACSLC